MSHSYSQEISLNIDKKCFEHTYKGWPNKESTVPVCANVKGNLVKDLTIYKNARTDIKASIYSARIICQGFGFKKAKKIKREKIDFALNLRSGEYDSRDELTLILQRIVSIECKF